MCVHRSDVALLYNDKAVLENHHLSASFRLLKEDELNITSTLKTEEYRFVRSSLRIEQYSYS